MENKILFVCAICTKSVPPLISLNEERKNILAAVTSVLHLREMVILMCCECNKLLDAVLQFQKIAVTGVHNLLLLKEKVKNSSKAISSKPNQKRVILQSKAEERKNALPSHLCHKATYSPQYCGVKILKCIPEDSAVTSKQDSTEAADIKIEPESHTEQYTHKCATSEDLTEEIHIKDEPEFETEQQLDFHIEPEEFKPDIHDLIDSNLYTDGSTANNNTDPLDNFDSEVNTYVGTSNILSKADQFEGNINIKSEPEIDESTDTCESDYGNEEDIILAALVKANTPTLPYLKGQDLKLPQSQSKTSNAKSSKRRRKTPARKSTRETPAEKMRRYRARLKENPEKFAEVSRKNLERIKSNYRKVTEMSDAEKELRRQQWRQQKEKSRVKQEQEIVCRRKALTVAERVRRYRERLKENPERLEEARRKNLERMKSKHEYKKNTELSNCEQELQGQKLREQNEKSRITEDEEITSKKKMPLTGAEKMRRYRERLKTNPEKLEEVRRKNLERIKIKFKYRKVTELSNAEQELRRKKWRMEKEKSRKKQEKEIACRRKALTVAERVERYRERLKENPEKLEEVKRKNLQRMKSKLKYRKVSELSNAEQELRRQRWRMEKEKSRKKQGKRKLFVEERL